MNLSRTLDTRGLGSVLIVSFVVSRIIIKNNTKLLHENLNQRQVQTAATSVSIFK